MLGWGALGRRNAAGAICLSVGALSCATGSAVDGPRDAAAGDSHLPEASLDGARDAFTQDDASLDAMEPQADGGGEEASGGDDASAADGDEGDATGADGADAADGDAQSGDGAASDAGVDSGPLDGGTANDAGADAGITGTYALFSEATGFVVDVSGQSTSSGASVIQWASNAGANQQWVFVSASGGAYLLINRHSNLLLDVAGTSVDQASASGGAGQQWIVSPSPTPGYYVLTSGVGTGVLTSPSPSQGAQLVVMPLAEPPSGAQQWRLQAAP